MFKELFKFHSKEEEFRVKCLILILLGIALIINPVNAWTEIYDADQSGSGSTWGTVGLQASWWGNMSPTRIDVVLSQCYSNGGGTTETGSHSSTIVDVATSQVRGNYTITWDVNLAYATRTDGGEYSILINDFSPAGDNYLHTYTFTNMTYTSGKPLGYFSPLDYSSKTMPAEYPHVAIGDGHSTSGSNNWVVPHYGHITAYIGSELPDPPVITDFTNDLSCYYPGQGIIFESDVSGELEDQLTWDWTWEIYDGDTFISDSSDPVETTITAPGVGVYDVQLTVTNDGGTDFMQKLNMINVTLGGNCTGLNNWSPFPTVPTVTPTEAVFPTLTVPPVIFINRTGVSDIINQSMWGNLSEGYRNYFDGIGEEVNSTVTSVASITLTPVSFLINSIATVISLFSESMLGLMSYTTIPLSITARVINIMPWEMQSIITAGLAIDALFLIFYGKG